MLARVGLNTTSSRIAIRVRGGGNYFSSPKKNVRFISSGCKLLDLALGGGYVEGRIVNIVGDKSTGKTLLCIEAAANFLIKYPKAKVRYRESEAAFDKTYAAALGMPIDRIDFGEPMETVEDFFEDLERVCDKAKGPELYILDSLDALSDRAELDRDMDKGSYGAEKAKKLSQLFRRLIRKLEEKQVTIIIVSQIRDKMNAMFGRKVTRTGGRALDFYATHVLFLAHIGQESRTVRGSRRAVAIKIKAKVDKNKIALPFREAEFKISFGWGIDDAEACVAFLKQVNGLKALKIRDPKLYIKELAEMSRSDFKRDLSELHDACETHWYAIEKELMPSRTKYGV
jgi:recombination protein RecA